MKYIRIDHCRRAYLTGTTFLIGERDTKADAVNVRGYGLTGRLYFTTAFVFQMP